MADPVVDGVVSEERLSGGERARRSPDNLHQRLAAPTVLLASRTVWPLSHDVKGEPPNDGARA